MSILSVEHINTGYDKKQVLFDINFDIKQGECVLLVGSNGSGKSTLFKVIYRCLDLFGKSGKEIAQLEQELKSITDKEVKVQISEIKRPELDAYLVAENIGTQLKGRISFRRAMKSAIQSARRMGAEGIRVMCSGRLGGAEMARKEQYKEGKIPLHTLRADIDYGTYTSQTIYGSIGIKVWIYRGEVLGKRLSD